MTFTVKAGYSNSIDLRAGIAEARAFFADASNFESLMPGVRQIHTDAKGVAHWQVEVEIPIVGKIMQRFAVEAGEHSDERVEWVPLRTEGQNFLRYSADFFEKTKGATVVQFTQMVELRRRSARDLHYLAGAAGESLINNEMTKRITTMISTFIDRAKQRLEKPA